MVHLRGALKIYIFNSKVNYSSEGLQDSHTLLLLTKEGEEEKNLFTSVL